MPPARRALALIVAGDALLIFGISLVAVPAAYIFAGASLVAYGLLFVDVDSSPRGRP
jgi:glucose dehydrogenase